jgi:uncharacterized protein YciI
MSQTFAAIVQRTSKWDRSKPPEEQSGFGDHVAYMGGLEADGTIAMAGLMLPSEDVLFIFRADSEDEVRRRLAEDPWQQDGHAKLARLEEIAIRIGEPPPLAP